MWSEAPLLYPLAGRRVWVARPGTGRHHASDHLESRALPSPGANDAAAWEGPFCSTDLPPKP